MVAPYKINTKVLQGSRWQNCARFLSAVKKKLCLLPKYQWYRGGLGLW